MTVIGKVFPDRPLSLAMFKGRPQRDAHDRPLEPAAGGTGRHSAGHRAKIVAPMTHVASPLVRRDDLGAATSASTKAESEECRRGSTLARD